MTVKMVHAALASAILVLFALPAFATVTPIQGTSVGLDHEPEGIIAKATTDRDGKVVFRNLAPDKYVLVIGGKEGLVAATDRDAPANAIRAEVTFEGTTDPQSRPNGFVVEACACRAPRPMRIGFALPQTGTATLRLEYGDPRIIGAAVGVRF